MLNVSFAAGMLKIKDMGDSGVSAPVMFAGVASAAIVGVLAIRGLISWLGRAGFAAFFIYRAALALIILITLARSA